MKFKVEFEAEIEAETYQEAHTLVAAGGGRKRKWTITPGDGSRGGFLVVPEP